MRLPFSCRSGVQIKLFTLAISVVSITPVMSAQLTYAQEAPTTETFAVDIEAGTLSGALNRLASQVNVALSFEPSLTAGKFSPTIQGAYTLQQILQQMLANKGLVAVEQDGGYVVQAISTSTDVITLDTIRVVGAATQGYSSTIATSATGIESSILDTPRSIQVVSEELIKDQQAQDLRDVLRNVSGVQSRTNAGNTVDSFFLRGIANNSVFQNGFALNGNAIRVQSANIDAVEVLKGPAALLFGRSSAGGIINVITKKPQEEAFNSISTHFDTFGQRRLQLDSTGAVNESGSLLYRIVGSFEESDTFRKTTDHDRVSRDLIAPSLTWRINENNTLSASYEWIDSSLPRARGTVLVRGADGSRDFAKVPRSRRFGEPGDSSDTIQQTATLDFSHVFQNDWVLDAGLVYQGNNSRSINTSPAAGISAITNSLLPDVSNIIIASNPLTPASVDLAAVQENGLLVRNLNQFGNRSDSYFANLRLSGESEWGGVVHNFIGGA